MDCINYMNGIWETESDSKVPIYDAGFLLGDGLFETIRFDNRKLFYPEKHLKRLSTGLEIIRNYLMWKLRAPLQYDVTPFDRAIKI